MGRAGLVPQKAVAALALAVLMRVAIVHLNRKWRPVSNHLDGRKCPECSATVHGNDGQREHRRFHEELAELLAELMERAGVEKSDAPWLTPWSGIIEQGELEAAEDG